MDKKALPVIKWERIEQDLLMMFFSPERYMRLLKTIESAEQPGQVYASFELTAVKTAGLTVGN